MSCDITAHVYLNDGWLFVSAAALFQTTCKPLSPLSLPVESIRTLMDGWHHGEELVFPICVDIHAYFSSSIPIMS